MTTSPAADTPLCVASSDRARAERPSLPGAGTASGQARPDGIWHGYDTGSSRTLCVRPLMEMYSWPDMSWPGDAPSGAACYPCQLVVEARL